jgi:hypothetical protein
VKRRRNIANTIDPMKEGFNRQRRNLIITSIILYIIEFAEPQLTQLSILGNVFVIGNPQFIVVLLWVALGYFLLRYWQYFNGLNDVSIRQYFKTQLQSYASSRAAKVIYDNDGVAGFTITDQKLDEIGTEIVAARLSAQYELDGSQKTEIFEFTGLRLTWLKLKVKWHIAFDTHLITEYVLPLFIAGALCFYKPIAYFFL